MGVAAEGLWRKWGIAEWRPTHSIVETFILPSSQRTSQKCVHVEVVKIYRHLHTGSITGPKRMNLYKSRNETCSESLNEGHGVV